MDPALEELYAEGMPDDEVAVILRLADPAAIPVGVKIRTIFGHIATCSVRRGDILRVRAQDQVRSMKAAHIYRGTPAVADSADGAVWDDLEEGADEPVPEPSDQRRPEGPLPTGRGVVVAHIDWGMDIAHPDFRKPDGRTRLLALWDQSRPYDPQRPNRYGYGRIYDAAEIDRALTAADPYGALGYDPAISDPGSGSHGTHTLSISCGNGRGGGPVGLAPEARQIFVHLSTYTPEGPSNLGDSVALLEGLDFIAQVAEPLPFVVNMSLGRQAGQHDHLPLTVQGMDAFLRQAPGRAIVQSTGNYYHRRIHACGLLRPGETRTLRAIVDAADRTPNELDLWYSGLDRLRVGLRAPDGTIVLNAAPGGHAPVSVAGREVGRLYHRVGDPNNGDNQVTLFLYRTAPPGEWELTLFGEDVADGRYHAWIERDSGCTHCQARFASDDSEPTSTTGSICNGLRTLAVGAYDARRVKHPLTPFYSFGQGQFEQMVADMGEERPLALFSSCGPTRDGRQKPDLVAPGVRVLAARSRPRLAGEDPPRLTRMSGTSMAAPHVTGTIALMFEAAGRALYIEETRRLLLANTDPPPEDARPTDRLRLGSGYLNTAAAVAAAQGIGLRPATSVSPKFGEVFADSDEKSQSEGYQAMSASSKEPVGPEPAENLERLSALPEAQARSDDWGQGEWYEAGCGVSGDTAVSEIAESGQMAPEPIGGSAAYEPVIEGNDEAAGYDSEDFEDYGTEAMNDDRHRRGKRLRPPGSFRAQAPFQLQVPVTGGAPALAVPVGGARSPVALTVPLGGSPLAGSPATVPAAAAVSPAPAVAPTGVATGPGPAVDTTPTSPATVSPPPAHTTEPWANEPRVGEPGATPPLANEPPVTVAALDAPLYVPPTLLDQKAMEQHGRDAEARRDTSPFQVQLPLTGGPPALAVPVGGPQSSFAFTIPLGGTAPPPTPPAIAQVGSPIPQFGTEPFRPDLPVTVAGPDATLYAAPMESDVDVDAMEQPETWQELDVSEWSPAEWGEPVATPLPEDQGEDSEPEESLIHIEAEYDAGDQVLAAAEAVAESDDTLPLSTAALLSLLLGGGAHAESDAEGFAIPSAHRGAEGPLPSATTLFNAFVYPNHPQVLRNGLHRKCARRFQVLAHPGEPMPDVHLRPGDLFVRVARGEGWGHVAVVATPELHRYDRLGGAGLRGEGYPRLRPGLYVQVVEISPRRRRRSDRFARRLSDGAGLVLPDTLLLRPRPASSEAESDDAPATATPCPDVPAERPAALRRGSAGPAVGEAQRKLNRVHGDAVSLGLPGLAGCPLVVDCRFGPRTEMAVRSFQQRVFSDPAEWDGVVGPKTWAQLDLLTGGNIAPPAPPPRQPPLVPPEIWPPLHGDGGESPELEQRRRMAAALIQAYVPSDTGDPRFSEIAKDYGGRGTTCGFLGHWMLWRLGCTNREIVNRNEPPAFTYRVAQNISRIWNAGRLPFVNVLDNGILSQGLRPRLGDIVFIKQHPNGSQSTEHVFVFLEEIEDGGRTYWLSADAGQRNGAGRECARLRRRELISMGRGAVLRGAVGPDRRVFGWLSLANLSFAMPPQSIEGVVGESDWGAEWDATGDLSDAFFAGLRLVGASLEAQPRHLMGVMMAESGIRPDAENRSSHAVGLIQFMPRTLTGLGWTQGYQAFKRLSAEEQLPWVERYFRPYKRHGLGSPGRLYQATFLPATLSLGSDPSTVIAERDGINARAYAANSGLDRNHTGRITVGDLTARIDRACHGRRWEEALARLEGSPSPVPPMPIPPVPPTPTPPVPPVGRRPMVRLGSRGPAVVELQGKLNAVHSSQLGLGAPGLAACPLTVDGIFGARTREAVISFQRLAFPSQPREWDGIVGTRTWEALDRFAAGPGPGPVPPVPPVPPTPPVPAGGVSEGRAVIDSAPLLQSHRGSRPDLILRWNRMGSVPDAVDVVIHLHGYSSRAGAMRIDRDKEPGSGLDFTDPDAPGAPGRLEPTLCVLPRGNFFGGRTGMGYDFPALVTPDGLRQLIDYALAQFAARIGGTAVRMRRLLLTAHSGGGAPLMRILGANDPDEVHVFDALYGGASPLIRWATARLARPDVAASGLRVLYIAGTGTAAQSQAVAQALRSILRPGDTRASRFRVEATDVSHGAIPRRFGWNLLRDAGVNLPLAGGTTPPAPQPTPPPPPGPTPDIVSVRGIRVARQIASQLETMLAAAEADGVRLSGGGYRSRQAQIELRRQHCGPTDYDIYEKPSSQCRPPTARPGHSMHERGLAIDFTHSGRIISSHDNPGFRWLAQNAERFGFRNLPSEPWHWSVNGR